MQGNRLRYSDFEDAARLQLGAALLEAGTIGLKGKSSRRLFAVVGDERVTQLPNLQSCGSSTIGSSRHFRSRSPDTRRIVSAIRLKTKMIAPGLAEFYRRISRRADHFRDEPISEEARPAE